MAGMVLLSIVTLLALSYASILAYYHKRIYPRIAVAGVSVSGLTIVQASRLLASKLEAEAIGPITVASQDRSWQISPETLQLQVDATGSAVLAFAHGHKSNITQT